MAAITRAKRPAAKSAGFDGLTDVGAQFEVDRDLPMLLNGVLTAAIIATDADFGNVPWIQTQDGGL